MIPRLLATPLPAGGGGRKEDEDEGQAAATAEGAGLARARLAIPLLVFDQAVAALPAGSQAALALECVRTSHDFEGTGPLRKELLRRIRAAFGTDPTVILALALASA